MEFINKIIEKVGIDKVLHFVCGGWITSIFTPFGWCGVVVGTIYTFIISVIKEKYLDDHFDWKDIIAAMLGCGVSIILYLIIFILKLY